MPPLICVPPAILDQSFPRTDSELKRAALALGNMVVALDSNEAGLILTPILRDFVQDFDFEDRADYPLLLDIHRLLAQLLLQPHDGVVQVDLSRVVGHHPHPIPVGCGGDNLTVFWADEMGRLLLVHGRTSPPGLFYIGVACIYAFAGERQGRYDSDQRAFPLVGIHDFRTRLTDADEWDVDANVRRTPVTFRLAKRNCGVIGAVGVKSPSSGSHYKVIFPGTRSWVLDSNHSRIPEQYLRELCDITGYPIDVIWHALLRGEMPGKRARLAGWII